MPNYGDLRKKARLVGAQAFQYGIGHGPREETAREFAERVAASWRAKGFKARVYYRSMRVDAEELGFEVVVVREPRRPGPLPPRRRPARKGSR